MTQLLLANPLLHFLFTDKHILKELPVLAIPTHLSINLSPTHSDQVFLYTTPLRVTNEGR